MVCEVSECDSCCINKAAMISMWGGDKMLPLWVLAWDTVTEQPCQAFQHWHLTGAAVSVHTGLLSGFSPFFMHHTVITDISIWIPNWNQEIVYISGERDDFYLCDMLCTIKRTWTVLICQRDLSGDIMVPDLISGSLESQGVEGLWPLEIAVSCERCS